MKIEGARWLSRRFNVRSNGASTTSVAFGIFALEFFFIFVNHLLFEEIFVNMKWGNGDCSWVLVFCWQH
jgi:hypothetical protein